MSQLQRIRPTKIELIRLRRQLVLAMKVHKVLRERLTILVNEFLAQLRESIEKRRKINELILPVYNRGAGLLGVYGENVYQLFHRTTPTLTSVLTTENIMGVSTRSIVLRAPGEDKAVYAGLKDFQAQAYELLKAIIELGKAEEAVLALGREIKSTKRRVNALNYIIIPRLSQQIRMLRMKFDEREREEKSRLKRVKNILEKRKKLE
ncbi:V-type ATP synthase subunit D [Thermosphaera chiliense]|uniref:V-type ATP synthase subunit D n=1 Tax=Thermosphaera chiliense TaxID=3402707 RepID=A0A7M1UTA0_9CREN|nr:V-type ATP synthase subunit D [Thermosphaera aggregans]